MRVQAFIASGILEKYALGMTSEDENRDILEMASQHMEVKEELRVIRKTLKQYILSHQVMPPPTLKEQVLNNNNSVSVAAPIRNGQPSRVKNASSKRPSNTKRKKGTGLNISSLIAGLLAFALLAACYVAYSFYQVAKNAEAAIATAQVETEKVQKELDAQREVTANTEAKLGFYTDPNNELIMMKGSRRAPGSKATIYWNDANKAGFIDIVNLPIVKEGRVPILWNSGTVRSVKLGVLKANQTGELTPIDYMEDATMFYVTEEENAEVERPNRSRVLMRGQ